MVYPLVGERQNEARMARFERVQELDQLLRGSREPLSLEELCSRLEASPATVKRSIRFLREQLNAPIGYDHFQKGYLYERNTPQATAPQPLPGLWFNGKELAALLTAEEVLGQISLGLLRVELAPLRRKLDKLLRERPSGSPEVARRVKLERKQARNVDTVHFTRVTDALIRRRRLEAEYHSRSRDETTSRVLSPVRLVYYRDNWYLAAWCHEHADLRVFAVDRFRIAHVLEDEAYEPPEELVNARLESAYGIYEGAADKVAVLRFTPTAARWVADEIWHADQTSQWLADGRYELRVPYRHDKELLMDVLRHGSGAEVVAPPALRSATREELARALLAYT